MSPQSPDFSQMVQSSGDVASIATALLAIGALIILPRVVRMAVDWVKGSIDSDAGAVTSGEWASQEAFAQEMSDRDEDDWDRGNGTGFYYRPARSHGNDN